MLDRHLSILIIEDNPADIRLTGEMLSEVKECIIDYEVASTLSEGVTLMKNGGIDAVLLDLSLSDSEGLPTLKTLHQITPEIPLVILTEDQDESVTVEALREGAQDFLIKGTFNSEMLMRSIRHAIERQSIKDELKNTIRDLQTSEERLFNIIHSNADGIVIVNRDNTVSFVNPAAEYILNKQKKELIGKKFEYPVKIGEPQEIEIKRGEQDTAIVEMRVVVIYWEGQNAFLTSFRDITELVGMREQLRTLAYKDELTGLSNRRGFLDIAEKMLRIADRSGRGLNLFFTDMDNMKWINDNLGHPVGDRALVVIGNIIGEVLRASDIIARIGGDEFAAIAVDSTDQGGEGLQKNIYKAFEERNKRADLPFELAVSIGRA
ncbi:MAG: diguanylate cyclase, partial [bacterium]